MTGTLNNADSEYTLGRSRVSFFVSRDLHENREHPISWVGHSSPTSRFLNMDSLNLRAESDELTNRYLLARAQGGKRIWSEGFTESHPAYLYYPKTGVDPAQSGNPFDHVRYRLTGEGTLTGAYTVNNPAGIGALELIAQQKEWEQAATHLFVEFASTLVQGNATDLNGSSSNLQRYRIVEIENLLRPDLQPEQIGTILNDPSIAGIANNASWYRTYTKSYLESVATKALAYRDDELYLVDRNTFVIVCDRLWSETDTVRFYRFDLSLLVEHVLSRLALLKTVAAFVAGNLTIQQIIDGDPEVGANRALAGRLAVADISAGLDLALYIEQGFTRRIAQHLLDQLNVNEAFALVDRRTSRIVEEIGLIDALHSARRSAKLSKINNYLQTSAVVISIAALVLSILSIAAH